jgi:methyltransferase (TIGR00027 family)
VTETNKEPLIRNISDTARWVAAQRARESDRPDALFRDPLARRLAGERGEQISETMRRGNKHDWSFAMRTVLIDRYITEEVQRGVDLVVNLAAGLDTRPYRMALPASLQWIEVDLPEIFDYKEKILAGEKPACVLERVRLDLSKAEARRELFAQWSRRAKKALVLTEGLCIYLTPEEVGKLAADLAAPPSFQRWILDLASPGLIKMLEKQLGSHLSQAGVPFKFAPREGPGFFAPYGWKPIEVHSLFKTAAKFKRLPFPWSLLGWMPESNGAQGSRPWSGICLFGKQAL